MNWIASLMNGEVSRSIIKMGDREIEVFCSSRADIALAKRDKALIVEARLSFGCLVSKEVRFLELPAAENVIKVNKKLRLLVTTFMPAVCEIGAKEQTVASPRLREFAPEIGSNRLRQRVMDWRLWFVTRAARRCLRAEQIPVPRRPEAIRPDHILFVC